MPASTDFLPFATGAGANVVSQSVYAADSGLSNGFSSGIASSAKFNKVFRQASFVAAGVATWMANALNTNIPDDGNLSAFVANLALAVRAAASGGNFIADTGSVNTLIGTSSPAMMLNPSSVSVFFPPPKKERSEGSRRADFGRRANRRSTMRVMRWIARVCV